MASKIQAVRDNQIQELDAKEADYELITPNSFFGSHINLIPMHSAVQGPRLFYGARFYNQALPLKDPQSPWVQNVDDMDPDGRSFDEIFGKNAGALYADDDAEVMKVDANNITVRLADGTKKKINTYSNFPFNRKTAITQTPIVKKGDMITKGQLLARSNYTDEKGALALGTNARVGMVPFKGYSMDDAIVVSEAFAKRLTSDHSYTMGQEFDHEVKGGLKHYVSLFPTKYTKNQLSNMDERGVVLPGTVVQPGDPLILATKPKTFSSSTAQLGKLSKAMRQSRNDVTQVWEDDHEGVVTDVAKTKKGFKVVVNAHAPAEKGDKIVFRSGQKGVIANIIPDAQMPRTVGGDPLEVLLNPLGVPSRANNSMIYELLLGKVASKRGEAIKIPSFNKAGEKWYDIVQKYLDEEGMVETEEVFDPQSNTKLQNPITVGNAHILKLHHTATSKSSARGQGGYCYDSETEVLTDVGWVPWPEVVYAHKFATLNEFGQISFVEAKEIHKFDYEGELYGFAGGRYIDYLVTPDHDHWVKFSKSTSQYRKVKAKDLHGRRFFVKQQGFEYLGNEDPQFIEVSIPKREFGSGPQAKSWRVEYKDYIELLGWWLSEGSVREKENKVFIWQHRHVNPDNFEQIKKLLNRIGFGYHIHKNTQKDSVGFCIRSRALAYHLIEVCGGRTSGTKKIPTQVMHASLESRHLLFETLMKGDGYEKGDNYVSKSKGLIDDFQVLVTGLGWSGCVYPRESFINNEGYNCAPHYYLGVSRNRPNATIREGDRYAGKFVKINYTGKVYCATLAGSGLLYVRRNGKPMWSGNSLDEQPLKGGSESAQAKRLSGLEVHSLLSAGAYDTLRESATLRGQKNDEYWRALRQGYQPRPPGSPFVWDKFQALLTGAGLHARKIPGGKMRLGPFTDDDLEARKPIEIKSGDLVDLNTMEPVKGGLFDQTLVGNNKWGKIGLPFSVPNPAFEDAIRHLLGLTKKELRAILAGEMDLPENLR